MGCRHEWLKAHSTNDLFERRVVADRRDEQRAHDDLGRIFEIFVTWDESSRFSLVNRRSPSTALAAAGIVTFNFRGQAEVVYE
jgi:hypothetical protein